MKTVFTLICIISAVHYATADCSALKTFTTELKPSCSPQDVYIKWPNYANQSTYYTCFGVGNPVLTACPSDQYFIYVLQMCGSCSDYIPPVTCDKLKTQNTPDCVAIGSTTQPGNNSPATTTGYPTPNYPDTTTTTVKTTVTTTPRTTTTKTTTVSSDSTTTTPSVPTPQVVTTTTVSGPTTTPFPGPPSPVTSNPAVPTPPTPPPTPPTVENEPPVVATVKP